MENKSQFDNEESKRAELLVRCGRDGEVVESKKGSRSGRREQKTRREMGVRE
jgi:hypothetical protein